MSKSISSRFEKAVKKTPKLLQDVDQQEGGLFVYKTNTAMACWLHDNTSGPVAKAVHQSMVHGGVIRMTIGQEGMDLAIHCKNGSSCDFKALK